MSKSNWKLTFDAIFYHLIVLYWTSTGRIEFEQVNCTCIITYNWYVWILHPRYLVEENCTNFRTWLDTMGSNLHGFPSLTVIPSITVIHLTYQSFKLWSFEELHTWLQKYCTWHTLILYHNIKACHICNFMAYGLKD